MGITVDMRLIFKKVWTNPDGCTEGTEYCTYVVPITVSSLPPSIMGYNGIRSKDMRVCDLPFLVGGEWLLEASTPPVS